jgi:hypothetical protein
MHYLNLKWEKNYKRCGGPPKGSHDNEIEEKNRNRHEKADARRRKE